MTKKGLMPFAVLFLKHSQAWGSPQIAKAIDPIHPIRSAVISISSTFASVLRLLARFALSAVSPSHYYRDFSQEFLPLFPAFVPRNSAASPH
jgi:hypothetical protein